MRSSSFRSACVVVGACQTRGRSAARALDRRPLGRGQGDWLFLGEPLVVGFESSRLGERALPFRFQLAGDEPVLGLGELILAAGPVSGVAGALQPLPPQLVQRRALVLGLRGRGHRDLQRGRRHRRQHLAGHVGVERRAGDVLAAAAGPVVDLVERAHVAVRGAGGA